MSEKVILYAGDLLRMVAYALAAFLAWWINHYVLPLDGRILDAAKERAEQGKEIALLRERVKNASHDRKRLEREIERLRNAHRDGK